MRRTFVDAGVLIAAARATGALGVRALAVFDAADRLFVSSAFVRLEVLPKAVYFRRAAEVRLLWPLYRIRVKTGHNDISGDLLLASGALHDFSHHRPAHSAFEGIVNLTNTHLCRASQLFDVFHKALGRARASERFPAYLGRSHACLHTF